MTNAFLVFGAFGRTLWPPESLVLRPSAEQALGARGDAIESPAGKLLGAAGQLLTILCRFLKGRHSLLIAFILRVLDVAPDTFRRLAADGKQR